MPNMALTKREQECVDLRAQGLKLTEVGKALNISLGTVKIHLKHARNKGMYSQRVRMPHIAQADFFRVILVKALNPREVLLSLFPEFSGEEIYDAILRGYPYLQSSVEQAREREANAALHITSVHDYSRVEFSAHGKVTGNHIYSDERPLEELHVGRNVLSFRGGILESVNEANERETTSLIEEHCDYVPQPVKKYEDTRCLCGGVGCNRCEPQGRG